MLALSDIDENDLKEKFDFEQMIEMSIYPLEYGEDEEEFFEYVNNYFENIKEFFKKASNENQAVVFYIS